LDRVELRKRVVSLVREYKYVALILVIGLILMLIPSPKEAEPVSEIVAAQESTPQELQDSLGMILSSLEGAGKVKVLLTQAQGERVIYQTDMQEREDSLIEDTVILSGSGKEQKGLIRQILPPKYQGAIILCQGAQNASVRLAIVEAVSNATGLSTDKITVLKMK